jgi:hypothetical protein
MTLPVEPFLRDLAARRLVAQRLVGPPSPTPVAVVAWLTAVQSQDYHAATWAVAQRCVRSSRAEIDQLFDVGAILRTHVLRPTWHFVLPQDISWLLELTAPQVKVSLAYNDRRQEIDAPLVARSHSTLEAALGDLHFQTRAELGAALERNGIQMNGQRLGHLLAHAELDGLIVSGPRRGKHMTYALLAERAPQSASVDRDAALHALTLRYFASHGPAQLADFCWWSGLRRADARRGLELVGTSLEREDIAGKLYWSAPGGAAPKEERSSVVRLLPNFDEFLVAYADRSASLVDAPDLTATAVLGNVVVVDGQLRGGWKLVRRADQTSGSLTVTSHQPGGWLDAAHLEPAVSALSRFLGVPVRQI